MRGLLLALLILFMPIQPVLGAGLPDPEDPTALPALLQEAVDARDSSLALDRLDLDSLVETLLENNLAWINDQVGQGKILLNPPLALALATLNTQNPTARRMVSAFLVSETRKFIVYGIKSGSFAGNPLSRNEIQLMDGGVFSLLGQTSIARKEFSHTRLLRREENRALIRTELFDAGIRKFYPLELSLHRNNGLWRVTGIENTEELTRKLLP